MCASRGAEHEPRRASRRADAARVALELDEPAPEHRRHPGRGRVRFFFLRVRRPPKSTHRYNSFPTRRSSDLWPVTTRSPISTMFSSLWAYTVTKPLPCSRSEEHTSELQSHSGISYAVFCL